MARKQCQVCGQPATVRVEANLNGRHSTMLLCDDHYRQLVRQQKRTVSPLEALFGSRSGLFEDFLGSDFFRIGDDATPVAADTDDVVDASFGEPAAASSGAPRRRGSGLASRISEQSEALLQEAAKHAAEFGRSEVDTEHLLLALADTCIAAQNAVVAAESLGIGSCYIGDVIENAEQMREALHLPEYVVPACMLVFGRPTDQQKTRRKPARFEKDAIVCENTYRDRTDAELRADFTARAAANGQQNYDFDTAIKAFCNRKYESDFSKEMTRRAEVYLEDFRK